MSFVMSAHVFKSAKPSSDALMKDITSHLLSEKKLKNEKIQNLWHFLICSARHDSNATFKTLNFVFNELSRNRTRSMEALKKGIKPVVSGKCGFEYQEISILTAIFEIFALSAFRCKKQNKIQDSSLESRSTS